MRGLYVHIPFCTQKCHYCDFVITVNQSAEMRSRFLSALQSEIKSAKARFGKLTFDTLYLGGGTPSILSHDEIKNLISFLKSEFEFREGHEFTCEMNPDDADESKLRHYFDLGINRISLGAQSFNDELLKSMGRVHLSENIASTMNLLRKTGFQNISIDLILKLPNQTIEDVENAVKQAMMLGAKQVSLYDLDVHEKTVYGAMQKRGTLMLPSGDAHEAMFACAESILSKEGFSQYEVSNFARPGFESRHNLIYWHNQAYLGLGPGAFSYMNGIRYQFASDVSRYLKKCEANDFTNDTEDVIGAEELEIENLITGIRLRDGVELGQLLITKRHFSDRLNTLVENNLISRFNNHITLTARGRFSCETVIRHLIQKE